MEPGPEDGPGIRYESLGSSFGNMGQPPWDQQVSSANDHRVHSSDAVVSRPILHIRHLQTRLLLFPSLLPHPPRVLHRSTTRSRYANPVFPQIRLTGHLMSTRPSV